jgi:hypothetical protein
MWCPFCCASSIVILPILWREQIVQLARLLESLNRVKVAEVFVVDVDDWQRARARLAEDGVAIVLVEHVDRNPRQEVGALVHQLGLEQALQVKVVALALVGRRRRRVEDHDFALAANALVLARNDGEHRAGNVRAAERHGDLVRARLGRRVDHAVLAVLVGGDLDVGGGQLGTVGASDLDGELVRRARRRLDGERRLLALHRLDEAGAVGDAARRVGALDALRRIDVAEVGDVGHHRLLVDARVREVGAVDHGRHAPGVVREIDAVLVVLGAVGRIETLVAGREAGAERVDERVERAAIVPVLLEAGDVVLGNLGANPVEQLLLGRSLAVAVAILTNLIVKNQRPDEAENDARVGRVNVLGADVDQFDFLFFLKPFDNNCNFQKESEP